MCHVFQIDFFHARIFNYFTVISELLILAVNEMLIKSRRHLLQYSPIVLCENFFFASRLAFQRFSHVLKPANLKLNRKIGTIPQFLKLGEKKADNAIAYVPLAGLEGSPVSPTEDRRQFSTENPKFILPVTQCHHKNRLIIHS